MIMILISIYQVTLEKHFKYLQHHRMTSRKFFTDPQSGRLPQKTQILSKMESFLVAIFTFEREIWTMNAN